MPSVLMVNLPEKKRNQLHVLSIRMNFACRDILPQEVGCRISDLLKGKAASCAGAGRFRDEMLIMDGFSGQDLNFLLNEMIRTHNTVTLKAVTTPTNITWTVAMLHAQLTAENREMNSRRTEARL